jgi:toxin ParE1/3/4
LLSAVVAKKHRVELTAAAAADIAGTADQIAADNPIASVRWEARIEQLISGLQTMPRAHATIPEAAELGVDYREKLFGNYRIIYQIAGDRVVVLRVIHGARLLDLSYFKSDR